MGQRYHEMYQSLHVPEQELDELNDSNSFLSMSINQINKDLEHSEIDTDFFLHNDLGFRPPVSSVQDQSSHSGKYLPAPSVSLNFISV